MMLILIEFMEVINMSYNHNIELLLGERDAFLETKHQNSFSDAGENFIEED